LGFIFGQAAKQAAKVVAKKAAKSVAKKLVKSFLTKALRKKIKKFVQKHISKKLGKKLSKRQKNLWPVLVQFDQAWCLMGQQWFQEILVQAFEPSRTNGLSFSWIGYAVMCGFTTNTSIILRIIVK